MPNINFHEEDWERIERDIMAWWEGELERPLVYLTTTDPLPARRPYSYITNYPLDMPAEQVVDQYEPLIASTHYYADAFPWWWINFGPGVAAGFLGSKVGSVTEPSETVWFSPAQPAEIKDLHFDYDPENIWWKRVKEITAAATERFGDLLQVSHTDLGGNLDIMASFRETQGLLFDVVDQPEEVDRLVKEITRLWLRYYDEQEAIIRTKCRGTSSWTPIWTTGKTYMMQCDFSYMISPAMFERFVMPDLTACCDHLTHGFYHLDGKGEIPHLDMLLSIQRLRGIQWIPGDGQPTPDQWLPLLKRIRDGGKLCQVFVSPEGALRIVKHLGGKGFLLVIYPDENEFRKPGVAEAFLKKLREEEDKSRD
jgi:hypothetical protein